MFSIDGKTNDALDLLKQRTLINKSTLVNQLILAYFVKHLFNNDDPLIRKMSESLRIKRENELLERELEIYKEQDRHEKLKKKVEKMRELHGVSKEQEELDSIINKYDAKKKQDDFEVLKHFSNEEEQPSGDDIASR